MAFRICQLDPGRFFSIQARAVNDPTMRPKKWGR
jgi:hypothetical protein